MVNVVNWINKFWEYLRVLLVRSYIDKVRLLYVFEVEVVGFDDVFGIVFVFFGL